MIAQLRGLLEATRPPQLVLDVNGIGYELEAPLTVFARLPARGQPLILFTHLLVREDAHLLFGFLDEAERNLFRHLIRINGVGARMALAILSGLSMAELVACSRDNDITRLTRVPGIGKKTAERLLVELRDKLKSWQDDSGTATLPTAAAAAPSGDMQVRHEAVNALEALGYKAQEADRLVAAVAAEAATTEQLIRAALQQAARHL